MGRKKRWLWPFWIINPGGLVFYLEWFLVVQAWETQIFGASNPFFDRCLEGHPMDKWSISGLSARCGLHVDHDWEGPGKIGGYCYCGKMLQVTAIHWQHKHHSRSAFAEHLRAESCIVWTRAITLWRQKIHRQDILLSVGNRGGKFLDSLFEKPKADNRQPSGD